MVVVFTVYFNYAQDGGVLRFSSLSLGVGVYDGFLIHDSYSENELNGSNLIADLIFELDDYFFAIYYGTSLNKLDLEKEVYSEINLTIGLKFLERGRFILEGHAGLGYYTNKYILFDTKVTTSTIGLPVRIKANYFITPNLGIGVNPNITVNGIVPLINVNFTLVYRNKTYDR